MESITYSSLAGKNTVLTKEEEEAQTEEKTERGSEWEEVREAQVEEEEMQKEK